MHPLKTIQEQEKILPPSQKNKSTLKISFKWACKLMMGVCLVVIKNAAGEILKTTVTNLHDYRIQLIHIFGPVALKIYKIPI